MTGLLTGPRLRAPAVGRHNAAQMWSPWGRRVLLAACGLLGMAGGAMLAAAGQSLGPKVSAVHLWYFTPVPGLTPSRLGLPGALAWNAAALGALVLAWLGAGLLVRRHEITVTGLALLAALWALPLLAGEPLYSPDVYTYAGVGGLVHHGFDPYLVGPSALHGAPVTRGVEWFWRHTPTPYSPLFVALTGGVTWATADHLVSAVVVFRLLALGSLVFIAAAALRWGGLSAGRQRRLMWLGVANPLVLVAGLSSAHNDVMMIALLVAGLLLCRRGHQVLGVAVAALGAGIKATALVVVAIVVIDYAWRQLGWGARLRALVVGAATAAVTLAALSFGTGWGLGWLHTLYVPSKALDPQTPAVSFAVVLKVLPHINGVVTRLGLPSVVELSRSVSSALAGIAVLACLLLVRRLGAIRASAWALLAVALLGPVFWPWYLLAPVLLFGIEGGWVETVMLAIASVVGLYVTLPGGTDAVSVLDPVHPAYIVLAVLAGMGLVWLAAWLWSRRVRPERLRLAGLH